MLTIKTPKGVFILCPKGAYGQNVVRQVATPAPPPPVTTVHMQVEHLDPSPPPISPSKIKVNLPTSKKISSNGGSSPSSKSDGKNGDNDEDDSTNGVGEQEPLKRKRPAVPDGPVPETVGIFKSSLFRQRQRQNAVPNSAPRNEI